jgi:uncharacterized protein
MNISKELHSKYSTLRETIRRMEKIIVAYSGGVDSTLLLKVGTDKLKNNCLGVIAVSESLSDTEYKDAIKIAEILNANLIKIETEEIKNPFYIDNDSHRCFYCKSELFTKIHELAKEKGIPNILDGNNLDDTSDYRPGRQAALDSGIRSPLIEAGFTKSDIRNLSRYLKLPNWNKPAQPCLASRIAYGVKVDPEVLKKIDQAEQYIRAQGFKIVRVRYMENHISVEVGQDEIKSLFRPEMTEKIIHHLQSVGFEKVLLDKDGYKSGKLNRALLNIQ